MRRIISLREVLEYSCSKIGEKYFPVIPVIISVNNKEFPLEALIDSGATASIFKIEVAESLDIDLEKCRRVVLRGIGGSITAYAQRVALKIGEKDIDTEVTFSKELDVKINLLGREGVFDSFEVCYNDKEKKVKLTEY